MQISDRRLKLRLRWTVVVLLLLAATLFAAMYRTPWPLLSNCCGVIFTYANQAVNGNGLVFNAGERVLLVPSPALLLMLAGAVSITSVPAYAIGGFALAISLIVGGLLVFRVLRRSDLSTALALLAIVVYGIVWIALWRGGTIAQPTASMFSLLALALALDNRWRWAGLIVAVAVLCSPEAGILAVPLLLMAANKGAGWRFFIVLLLPLIVAVIGLYLYYGPTLWYGLLGYNGLDLDYLLDAGNFAPLILPVAALIVWAFSDTWTTPLQAVCGVWIVLHLFVVGILLRSATGLDYVLLASPSVLLLFAASQQSRVSEMSWLAPAFTSVLVVAMFLLIVPIAPGSLTSADVPMGATQRFVQNTRIINFTALDGELQPDLKAMLERGDIQSILIRYVPGQIALTATGQIQPRDMNLPGVLRLNYQRQGTSSYYTAYNARTFQDKAIAAAFGPDMKLVGMGLDWPTLEPGRLLRVRLDWQVAHPADQDITVDLRLVSGDGDVYILAHATDTFEPRVFRAGPYSTYHTLSVIKSAWDGPVTLQAAVIINNGVAARVPIATLTIMKP